MSNLLIKQFIGLLEEDAFFMRTVWYWISDIFSPVRKIWVPIKRYSADASITVFIAVLVVYVFFPSIVNADMEREQMNLDSQTVGLIIESMQNETRPYGRLTLSADATPRKSYLVPITAYTSEPAQTDDTPCVTASGLDVCERNIENVVAANFLPLGTRVRIPELYGDRVFYVEDRMNKRYNYKMDIWMKEKSEAKVFGVKYATIEVF